MQIDALIELGIAILRLNFRAVRHLHDEPGCSTFAMSNHYRRIL